MSEYVPEPLPVGTVSQFVIDTPILQYVCDTFGNGDAERGFDILRGIASTLDHARDKHPTYAEGPYHALGVIHAEFRELEHAVEHEPEARQRAEARDVIATCVRYLNEEYKRGNDE